MFSARPSCALALRHGHLVLRHWLALAPAPAWAAARSDRRGAVDFACLLPAAARIDLSFFARS